MVATIFHGVGRFGVTQLPYSLNPKLGFLRKGYKHLTFAPIKAEANKLLDDIHNMKDERHGAVHGALVGSDALQTIRVRYTPMNHVTSISPVTAAGMEATALKARLLSERTLSVAIDSFNLVRPNDVMDNPFR